MSGGAKTRSHTTKRTIYGAIQAVTAKIAAAVLKPAAQTSNFDASPASPRSHAARRSIGCRRGPRSSFAHAATAARSKTAEKEPKMRAVSSTGSALGRRVPQIGVNGRRQ